MVSAKSSAAKSSAAKSSVAKSSVAKSSVAKSSVAKSSVAKSSAISSVGKATPSLKKATPAAKEATPSLKKATPAAKEAPKRTQKAKKGLSLPPAAKAAKVIPPKKVIDGGTASASTNDKKDQEAPQAVQRSKPKMTHRAQDSWGGNSDSDGSVDSAVLDEDICFHCGKATTDEADWSSLIICDVCEAEYHLSCLNLAMVPRNKFRCHKCIKDEVAFEYLKFEIDDPRFKIASTKRCKAEVVYSPSRPLEFAFEECTRKGLMVVSDVFSYEVMKKLTHGTVCKQTKSGRQSEAWTGVCNEVVRRLSGESMSNVIDRDGRYDIRLPDFVVEELGLPGILEPILNKLRTIMGTPKPVLRTHNVVLAPVGSTEQLWHTDDTLKEGKVHKYFTILIHLNPIDSDCGGTEIWYKDTMRGDMIRGRPGDAFVFNGSLLHRGQANGGKMHRFFYYSSFACRSDANINTGN